jgi:hypothetical protein
LDLELNWVEMELTWGLRTHAGLCSGRGWLEWKRDLVRVEGDGKEWSLKGEGYGLETGVRKEDAMRGRMELTWMEG